MANLTIFEFEIGPDANGDLEWPASRETTVTSSDTHTLSNSTRYVVICADADCRIGFNAAAKTSGMVILSVVDNPFKLAAGSGRTLRFA
jgi:hypothetical protein